MAESGSKSAFTDAEKAAMKERAREQREFKKLSGEEQIRIKVAEMRPDEQSMIRAIHERLTAIEPKLEPRTWYGMPAYYFGGKVVCFFQPGSKFESRYSTFGFQDAAKIDEGTFWPTSWALTSLTPAILDQIESMVRKAISA